MKKVLAVFATMAAVAALSSCCGDFESGKIGISEKFPLAEGRTDTLDVNISAEFPVSGLGRNAEMKVSAAIAEALFGEEYMSMNPEAAAEAYKTDLVDEYLNENLPMTEIPELESSSLSWASHIQGNFTYTDENILSYTATRYTYSGGAHGMTAETAYNFDRNTGNAVTEENFFNEGYVGKLTELLTAHLPEALESPADTSMLFLKTIEPNGNFSIGNDGVTYIYNQYEIAPYSMGIIRISVPWEELDGLLRGKP